MKFKVHFLKHIGVGIMWQSVAFKHEIWISLPIICFFIGFGKKKDHD